jgi:hypothetical protein
MESIGVNTALKDHERIHQCLFNSLSIIATNKHKTIIATTTANKTASKLIAKASTGTSRVRGPTGFRI